MVFVLDKNKKPLAPCTERRARILLEKGRARVHKVVPFTIRVVDRKQKDSVVPGLRIKIDPGSKATGVALVRENSASETHVLWLGELMHRGGQIRDALTQRAGFRRRRRSKNLRYRTPRFNNRTKHEGWLAPSLRHRLEGVFNLVQRLRKLAPVDALAMELNRFDTQLMENSKISGVEYQQGSLAGYELWEYLLEKWGRKCAYCDAKDVPLEKDHIVPKSKGGSNRASNFTLSCRTCNEKKGNRSVQEFLAKKPDLLARILAKAKIPLRDAAAVNSVRWATYRALLSMGLPVQCATGGRTKWNRTRMGIPKTHSLDAACVGIVEELSGWQRPVLSIKSMGRGAYKRTRLTKDGFPRGYLMHSKKTFGFQTGDLVKASVHTGKYQGTHVGRVAVRASGYFAVQSLSGKVDGISYKLCSLLQRADGYLYSLTTGKLLEQRFLPGLNAGVSALNIR